MHSFSLATGEKSAAPWPLEMTPTAPRSESTGQDLIFLVSRILTNQSLIRVWDAASGTFQTERRHDSPFQVGLRFSGATSRRVASFESQGLVGGMRAHQSSNLVAFLWDARTGRDLIPPMVHRDFIQDVAFSPDGRWLATASGNFYKEDVGEVRFYELPDGRLACPPQILPHCVGQVVFSPDSRKAAMGCADVLGSSRAAYLLDLRTWQRIGEPMPHQDSTHINAFSPDSRRLFTSSGGSARVWGAETSQPVSREMLIGPRGPCIGGFSPDSRRVFTATSHGIVRWWDADTGEAISSAWQFGDNLNVATCSTDGRCLIIGNQHGGVRLLRLEPASLPVEDLQKLAEVCAGRALDRHGGMEAIPAAELHAKWEALRVKYPAEFRAKPASSVITP